MLWDEAHPLGNGLLGALVWGDGRPLKISLDRTDLWDLRPVPEYQGEDYSYERMRQWVKEGRIEDLHRLYDDPYRNPGPTKIPAGRIELTLGDRAAFEGAALDLATAVSRVRFDTGTAVAVRVHAVRPVGLIEVVSAGRGDAAAGRPGLREPGRGRRRTERDRRRRASWRRWGTPLPKSPAATAGPASSRRAGVASGSRWPWPGRRPGIAGPARGRWPRPRRAKTPWAPPSTAAGTPSAATSRASHEEWWTAFWSRSTVRVPNPVVERQWYLDTYKFGAAARPDTPPITLQGPWTADNGKIPPWKGDYHHDLNTELSYWPCYSGNRLEDGLGFLDWLWDTRGNAREWTRRFFDLPGLNVPMTADLENRQIGGWHQYTHSSTTAAWLSHHFYLHWRYSMDRDFLRDRAYPFLRETAVFLEAVTEKGDDGKRHLPLSRVAGDPRQPSRGLVPRHHQLRPGPHPMALRHRRGAGGRAGRGGGRGAVAEGAGGDARPGPRPRRPASPRGPGRTPGRVPPPLLPPHGHPPPGPGPVGGRGAGPGHHRGRPGGARATGNLVLDRVQLRVAGLGRGPGAQTAPWPSGPSRSSPPPSACGTASTATETRAARGTRA